MNEFGLDVPGRLERRRLAVFLLFAFGVAWITAGVLYVSGGLTDSPEVTSVGGVPVTLATLLLPTAYMFAPGVANVVTRIVTDEGRDDLMLSIGFLDHWRSYVFAWFAPGVVTALGAALFFVVFPEYFDPTAEAFASTVDQQAGGTGGSGAAELDPLALALVTIGAAAFVNPLINAIFGFGEEFGWRGYLLPKLTPLGLRTAIVVHGLIWGVWHWPLIAMGYEYGFGYVGAPWTGLGLFLVFTVATGTFLAWVTLWSGSVWPASLGHGVINATVVVGVVFARGDPSPLLGPLPIGLVGMIPWLALAGYLLFRLDENDPAGAGPTAGSSSAEPADE